jgi:hypothetical protein
LIRVMSTLVGCTCILLEAPRGPFYRHRGPRSRWKQTRKANLAFCRVAHRTVRCTPDTVRCPICFHKQRSQPLPTVADLAHRTVRCTFRPLAHRTVRCTPDSPVNFSRSRRRKTRERPLRLGQPGAPDTIRCTTGHCPVHHRTVRCPRPNQSLGCTQPSLLFSSSFCF